MKEELKRDYSVTDIQEAKWIKTKNSLTRPFLVSFQCDELPPYLEIPGERALIKVHPYFPSPMRCKKCQEYQHTQKYCPKSVNLFICGKCAQNHKTEECTSNESKCYHCSEPRVWQLVAKRKDGTRNSDHTNEGKNISATSC